MPFVHVLFRTVQFIHKRKDDSVQIHETRLLKECAPELDGPAMLVVGTYFLYRQFNNNICLSCKRRVFVRGYSCYSSLRFSGQPCNITGDMRTARTAARYQQITFINIWGCGITDAVSI